MKKGFLIAAKKLLHALPEGSARHAASGSASLIRRPPTCLFKPSHWAAEGQPASPGRTLRGARGLLASSSAPPPASPRRVAPPHRSKWPASKRALLPHSIVA